MRVDVRPHLDLLDVDRLLLLAGFRGFLLGLILEAAVIENLADRRFGIGRYLDKIEADVGGNGARFFDGDNSVVLALVIDKLDLRNVDFVIDAWTLLDRGRCAMRSANGLGLLLLLNGNVR